nr:MAG TPA: hypothetical protein [Caudoviricetes sp.]
MIPFFVLLCIWNLKRPFSKIIIRNSRERPPKGGCFLAGIFKGIWQSTAIIGIITLNISFMIERRKQ